MDVWSRETLFEFVVVLVLVGLPVCLCWAGIKGQMRGEGPARRNGRALMLMGAFLVVLEALVVAARARR